MTNGREALHSFVRERPDLILMDIKMPEMNGIEATNVSAVFRRTFRLSP